MYCFNVLWTKHLTCIIDLVIIFVVVCPWIPRSLQSYITYQCNFFCGTFVVRISVDTWASRSLSTGRDWTEKHQTSAQIDTVGKMSHINHSWPETSDKWICFLRYGHRHGHRHRSHCSMFTLTHNILWKLATFRTSDV